MNAKAATGRTRLNAKAAEAAKTRIIMMASSQIPHEALENATTKITKNTKNTKKAGRVFAASWQGPSIASPFES